MRYWLAVVTPHLWQSFRGSAQNLFGFPRGRRPARGDLILCYLSDPRRYVGVLSVEGESQQEASVPWEAEVWYQVLPGVVLDPAAGLRGSPPERHVQKAGSLAMSRSPYRFRHEDFAASIVRELGDVAQEQVPEVPTELVTACRQNESVLFVGSGLPVPAGIPEWTAFVPQLLDWAAKSKLLDAGFIADLQGSLRAGEHDVAADSIMARISAEDLDSLLLFLRRTFLGKQSRSPTTYSLLPELPFTAVLTANFDELLERAYRRRFAVYTPADVEEIRARQTDGQFHIVKLYGRLDRPETIIVAPAQYEQLVAENSLFAEYLQGLFASRTILFVGVSLKGVFRFLSGLRFRAGPSPRTHYALIAIDNEGWRPQADQLERRFGVRVIPFRPTAQFFQVREFLEQLRVAITRPVEVGGNAPAHDVAQNSWLKRLSLRDIGPFDRLEMNLDEKWNLILGDNGVGKSCVLKSIALAMCGTDAADYAHRLIKVGKRFGSITLETNRGDRYVTKIKLGDKRALVTSEPSRPLEAEGWLSLGFPALRMMTWQPTTEVSAEGTTRPTTEDLMSLVRGETDPRMDKVKQWLLSMEYRIGTAKPKAAKQLREVINTFRDRVLQAIPGGVVGLGTVDVETRQVSVQTPEGLLPMEAVSQGTTSLLGWLAVLCQRLFDLYGDGPNPLDQYALVLVDEIDAHMHPEWQQTIVLSVKKIYPNVQIIATTHSPLVAASMRLDQITVFRRDPETRLVEMTRPADDAKGMALPPDLTAYRADQLLTSTLFGLNSTRSPVASTRVNRYAVLATMGESVGAKEREERKQLHEYIIGQLSTAERPSEMTAQFKADTPAASSALLDQLEQEARKASPGALRQAKTQRAAPEEKGE